MWLNWLYMDIGKWWELVVIVNWSEVKSNVSGIIDL